ncbi:MAG: YkvA family protein [Syntrophomonadaceae bacterium]|nr:YkvA family protein [Syntrophomonadaceae bacterium]
MEIKRRARQLKTDIPAVFWALKDKETPAPAKVMAGITVAYALSPLDLIPDFIPLLGYLDDIVLLPALVALTIKLIPAPVWERSRAQAQQLWASGPPRKWYFAIPVILIWMLLLALIIRALVQ